MYSNDFGKVPLLVSESEINGKMLRIFRELRYRRNFYNENGQTRYAMTLLQITANESIRAIRENKPELMYTLERVVDRYSGLLNHLDSMQEYMPRTFSRLYEKLITIKEELSHIYTPEIQDKREQINSLMVDIMTFWMRYPEILIRLPPNALQLITPELFLREDYLPYTLGIQALPDWLDPQVIRTMNKARIILQKREQTEYHQDIFRRYLVEITKEKSSFPSEMIELIVSFVPIDFVFDLMDIKTPYEFFISPESSKYEKQTCSDYMRVYVS